MSVETVQNARTLGAFGDILKTILASICFVDLNSQTLFLKSKKNTGVISVSDYLPVYTTPTFASPYGFHLLEYNKKFHHFLNYVTC